jgi:hypothetical protein
MLEVALAVTVTGPETVAFAAGAVIDTVGLLAALLTVTATGALVLLFPVVSFAIAVSVWEALVDFVVSHE